MNKWKCGIVPLAQIDKKNLSLYGISSSVGSIRSSLHSQPCKPLFRLFTQPASLDVLVLFLFVIINPAFTECSCRFYKEPLRHVWVKLQKINLKFPGNIVPPTLVNRWLKKTNWTYCKRGAEHQNRNMLRFLTFFKCLFTHFVKVFFCMASRSSEEKKISWRRMIWMRIGRRWDDMKA